MRMQLKITVVKKCTSTAQNNICCQSTVIQQHSQQTASKDSFFLINPASKLIDNQIYQAKFNINERNNICCQSTAIQQHSQQTASKDSFFLINPASKLIDNQIYQAKFNINAEPLIESRFNIKSKVRRRVVFSTLFCSFRSTSFFQLCSSV